MLCCKQFIVWMVLWIIISGFTQPFSQNLLTDYSSEEVAVLPGKDSIFLNPVYYVYSGNCESNYECILQTPVCNDTLCQVVKVKILWDLIGDFIRFDTLPGYPLTKNDHLPFTTEDYNKLQITLEDGNSILGRKNEKELLDNSQMRYSEKTDAITGATDLQIKNAVVDGALYSTYTLWHLVNGNIKTQLLECTLKNYDSEIENQLLLSENPKLNIFALKQLSDLDYIHRFTEIIQIMQKGHSLVNFYIAKQIPAEAFIKKENIKSLEMIWPVLDPNTKSILEIYLDTE